MAPNQIITTGKLVITKLIEQGINFEGFLEIDRKFISKLEAHFSNLRGRKGKPIIIYMEE